MSVKLASYALCENPFCPAWTSRSLTGSDFRTGRMDRKAERLNQAIRDAEEDGRGIQTGRVR